ncbi:MAG TPA: patatin-like phospholipase family protein [Terriglobales bacterium]|nr:patatin-like phospholipase family protein [Terriglobales bacterium]
MYVLSRSFAAVAVCFLLSVSASSQDASSSSVASSQNSSSQDSRTPQKRLKIGVALEGGGALGLAHIGVLQWFEDHHIPIDYVAGTSMGGLVAGLYATGKSPAELRAIVEKQDWNAIIDGQTGYRDLSFRRKEDTSAFPNRLDFGLKNGFSLPSGLNSGHGVSLLIDRETLPYTHNGSFDNLPIPFRCVATNLATGQAYVFDHGSIAQAMRSTMSIPGLFAPVRIGNDLFVDGGLLGNLPTDVVRKMGADVVIAVHLETAPTDTTKLQGLFSVLGQSIEVVIHQNEIHGLAGADLVVNVDLKEFTSLEYDQAEAIINRGVQAATAKANILTPYSLDAADWSSLIEQRKEKMQAEVPVPKFLEVRGTDPKSAQNVGYFLRSIVGNPIDLPSMEHMFNRLTGIGKFDSVDYWLEEKDGQPGLIVYVHEKSYAPPTVQLGFVVDGTESKNVTFTQAGRLTFLDVAGYRSEWRTDFSFGNTYGISTKLYRPFNALSKWFVAPHVGVSNTGFDIFDKGNPVALYRVHQESGGVDVGYGFSRFSELRAGYEIGYTDAQLNLGRPDFAAFSGRLGETHLRFRTDHTGDPVVPRRGYKAEVTFHWYDAYPGAASGLPALVTKLEGFQPVSAKGSVFATAEGGSTFGVHNTGIPLFFLGAPLRLSAYGTNELFGEQYYLFRVGYIRTLLTLPPFVGKRVYAVGSYEFAKMYGSPGESGFPNDVEAGVVAETALGPLFIGGSVGDSGHQKWFFQLGRVF